MTRSSLPDPARTRLLAEQWGTWVLPHWLERQADPSNPAFVPSGSSGGVTNSTAVDCVPVGVLDGGVSATVDPRGLVTFADGAWSLDWWVGADDRWHLPSREVAVRQRLVDDVPVVETAMRVPGGDVVQRVWAFHDPGAGAVVAIDLHNDSRLPVAIALSVRPYGPAGAGHVERIDIGTDHLVIDGSRAVWLPKVPAHQAGSSFAGGDVAEVVLGGTAGSAAEGPVSCAAMLATAALVYPLPHTASIRFLIPMQPVGTSAPTVVPPHDAVARGWVTQLNQGLRLELPDAELAAVVRAASAQLLLDSSACSFTGPGSTSDTASIVDALDRLGHVDAARAMVASVPLGQGSGGRLGGDDPAADATSSALVAAGRHWLMTRDVDLAVELAGALAAGAHHHTRSRRLSLRSRPPDATPLDLGRRVRGLVDVADALDGCDQGDAATAVRELAAAARAELAEARRARRIDADSVSDLSLVVPLNVVDPSDAEIDAILEWMREHATVDGGVAQLVGSTGLSPELTALVGRVELRRGEPTAMERVEWLVRAGGPSRTWSGRVLPRLGTGCGAEGWSAPAAAAVLHLVLDLLVHESADGRGLVLCAAWPEAWLGSGLEVHDAPTPFGLLSFAVRWHGERPALLWEIAPHPGVESVALTIPGLDPAWSSTDLRGDALLARPAFAPATDLLPGPAEGESFA